MRHAPAAMWFHFEHGHYAKESSIHLTTCLHLRDSRWITAERDWKWRLRQKISIKVRNLHLPHCYPIHSPSITYLTSRKSPVHEWRSLHPLGCISKAYTPLFPIRYISPVFISCFYAPFDALIRDTVSLLGSRIGSASQPGGWGARSL